jgi:nitroreductase
MNAEPRPERPRSTDALQAMSLARATKHFKSDPVPDEMVDWLIWAATRAPSPVNTQCWDFIIVRDETQRQRLGDALSGFDKLVDALLTAPDPTTSKIVEGTKHLAATLRTVPVIVVVVGSLVYPPASPKARYTYSATYAAAQNLVVAASSIGLGAAFTTLHEVAEADFRHILAIPDDKIIAVTIPVGWPAHELKPVRRRPLHEVAHEDAW